MRKHGGLAEILRTKQFPGVKTDTRFQAETANEIFPGMKPGQFESRQQFKRHMDRPDVKRYFHAPFWKTTRKSIKQIRRVLKGEEKATT